MKIVTVPAYLRWLATLLLLVLCGTLLLWSRLVWTPLQRYYFGPYLRCSWPGANTASLSEIRWIYKSTPNGKQELAQDDDVTPAPTDRGHRIPIELSPAAWQAGWTSLLLREERLQVAALKPLLKEQFYDDESLWAVLLMPMLCGFALYLFLLIAWSKYEDWIESIPWPVEWIERGKSAQSFLYKWTGKIGRIRSRLPELEKCWTRKVVSVETPKVPATTPQAPLKQPSQAALPLFGANDGIPKEGFAWDKRDEID